MLSPGNADMLRLYRLRGQVEQDTRFSTLVTMDLPNHKATSWAQFNLAVSGVCMCVYVCRTNLFKYRSKQLLILRCILKTFKCTSIKLQSHTQ